MKKQVLILFFLVFSTVACFNRAFPDGRTKYERKSVSYINNLFFTGSGIRLSRQQQAYLLDAIKKRIEMERFDCNPLPDNVVREFLKECKRRVGAPLTELDEILDETVAKGILHILDINKEIRAREFLTEVDQNSFVATKAKDLGITAQDLEKIMNSAYIYVPFIDSCTITGKGDSKSVTLSGGIAWYRLSTQGGQNSITFVDTISGEGFGGTRTEWKLGETYYKKVPFQYAADMLAKNLKIATREIPEFSLGATLARVDRETVWFTLGKKEGVNKDDKYYVKELVENKSGNIHEKKLGFVRVTKVGDNQANPKAMTKAKVVHGRQFEKGMFVLEHPLSPLEVCAKVHVIPVTFKQGWLEYDAIKYFEMPKDRIAYAYVGALSTHYNLVNVLNLSQTFVTLELQLGAIRPEAYVYDQQYETDLNAVFGVHGGVMKKFYFGPLALVKGAKFGVHWLHIQGKVNEVDHKFDIVVPGFTFDLGIELAFAIDGSLGGGVTYRLFEPNSSWMFQIKDDEKEWHSPDPPEVDFSGLGYNVYLSVSLPRFF